MVLYKTTASLNVSVLGADADSFPLYRQPMLLSRFCSPIGLLNESETFMGNLWIDTGFVFTQKTGKVMHPDSVTDWFGKFSKRNNLPSINPHKFRHTQASLLIHEGVDIVSVSKRLGHSKVSTTTDFYSHILANADRSACDALDKILFVPSSIDTELK